MSAAAQRRVDGFADGMSAVSTVTGLFALLPLPAPFKGLLGGVSLATGAVSSGMSCSAGSLNCAEAPILVTDVLALKFKKLAAPWPSFQRWAAGVFLDIMAEEYDR